MEPGLTTRDSTDHELDPSQAATLGKLFAHACIGHNAVYGTGQAAVMPFGWEGHSRSGVAVHGFAPQISVVHLHTGLRPKEGR